MSQGNPNKVNAIVDEIVKNNNVFKLKSPIEQDKEKDSIAKSINSAISVLNEVGKELVLQELSVDPDEKFKGFIDSVGNVDVLGLTQMTATIVKAKIEEAEREGIDLRQGQHLYKDNGKTLLVEGALTIAIVDTMIKNYDNLSYEDRKDLWDNFLNLPKDKQKAIIEADRRKLKEVMESEQTTEEQKEEASEINEGYKKADEVEALINSNDPQKIKEAASKLKVNTDAVDQYVSYMRERDSEYTADRINWNNPSELLMINNCSVQNLGQKSNKLYEKIASQNKEVKEDFINIYYERNTEINKEDNSSELQEQTVNDIQIFNKRISLEIEQLPNALVKAGFSQEEIHENFTKYISTLKSFEIDDIENFKKWDTEIRKEQLESFLIEDGMDEKMAEILSKINFNGQLFNILGNEEQKKEFFEQFDKVINQENIQERDIQLDGELEEIFSQYFRDNVVDMNVSAIEAQKEQITDEQVKQEETKEMYSFIDAEYLKQDSIEGLIPRNGENSQSLQDDKKSIFYSQGKEGAIVTYFEFLKQYERLKGSAGDKALEQYASYKNGTIELSDEQVQLLQGQLKQITQMRETKDFDEFMGDKLYLKLNGIDMEQDRQAAEEWRASHPGTRMHYNYANSWTNNAISPDRIDVVSLQSKDGKDVRTSQKDLIKYFLSQTSIDKIEELGVNDTTLENIRKYYQEHSAEIAQMGEEYSVVTQNIQEFEQSRENSDFEKQAIEQEKDEETSQNMAMVEQDNSFIGKIKRVFANMRDMKNKDNSKGFFARLGASIQTVFGNKKEEFYTEQDEISTYDKTEDKIQPATNSQQIDYLNQHFEVNTQEAIKKTEESKKAKEFLSTEDKTADKEEK